MAQLVMGGDERPPQRTMVRRKHNGSTTRGVPGEDVAMQPFELRGHELVLVPPVAADIDRITEICQDAELQRWLTSVGPGYERAQAEAFVTEQVPAGWHDETLLTWTVRRPEERSLLGLISLSPRGPRAEVGFWLAPEARGAGVMSRAVRLAAEYAFDTEGLDVSVLRWRAMVGNWASRRVAWACGFRFAGVLRGDLTKDGVARDAWVATLGAGEPMKPASTWFDVPTLTGNGVTLRPFVDADVDSIVEACNDPVTQHWLGGLPSPYSKEMALSYVAERYDEAASGRGVHWAVTVDDDGPAMGSFSLMGFGSHDGGAEVGYWVHPGVRGKGVATAAVRLMTRHAFAEAGAGGLGLRRLVVAHVSGNDASRVVIERCGFRPYGVERAGDRIRGGTIVDLHWYDLLLDDVRGAGFRA